MSARSLLPALATLALGAAQAAVAQDPSPRDTLRLAPLYEAARRADPRERQTSLEAERAALRLRSLDAERLPALLVEAQAQHQSEVVSLPIALPDGRRPAGPPKDTYDARVGLQQTLLDPSTAARRTVERARLDEAEAGIRTSLFAVRSEVNDAFFGAAALETRARLVEATVVELDARRRDAAARVREGTSLPSDTATLAATILQRRQEILQLRTDRRAALARLAALTDGTLDDAVVVAVPDDAATVARARAALDTLRARPEFTQFATTRERLARQTGAVRAEELPRVSAFARAGVGRPGLDFLERSVDAYWLGGVQVRWTPWSWGATSREREGLALQREIVSTNERAFVRSLRRAADAELATIDRLVATLALDDDIVALRARVERETRARLDEGVVTAAEYVGRESELLAARVARDGHRVELAQARARFLTLIGWEAR